MSKFNPRVLVVAEHASLKFGGEAALPIHYFRILRQRGLEVWLVVHERTRDELKSVFTEDFARIHFVRDTFWHRVFSKYSKILPKAIAHFTFGLTMRLMTQIAQRRIIKQVMQEQQVDIVHQPIPVSPKEPSMIFDLGIPVIIGPMNGGMSYPPAFKYMQGRFVEQSFKFSQVVANILNRLIPGKRKAATLLVANQRAKNALPKGITGKVIELVENGVDLSIWQPKFLPKAERNNTLVNNPQQLTKFIYVGRLVDWKAVEFLILAFKQVLEQVPAELEIIGAGPQRPLLEQLAKDLNLIEGLTQHSEYSPQTSDKVHFRGWLSQAECAQYLQQADVMVLPSLHECGGAVILEAMAVGLPVIATNWGGPSDYIDESCGILVEPSSQESFINGLATAMLKMAHSIELRQAMGIAGHQRVRDYFNWEAKVDTILKIYQETIESYSAKEGNREYRNSKKSCVTSSLLNK